MAGKRINSRAKGAAGERLARDYLHQLGFNGARRGQQFCGSADSPDVVCAALPNVHLEVKRVEGMDLGNAEWRSAIAQACSDAGGKRWAILWRPNRQRWRLTYLSLPGVWATVCGDSDIQCVLNELNGGNQ